MCRVRPEWPGRAAGVREGTGWRGRWTGRMGHAAVCGACARAGRLGERTRVAGRPKREGAAVWAEGLVAGPNGRRKEAAGWAVAR